MEIARIKELLESKMARIEKYQDAQMLIVRKFDPHTGAEIAPDVLRLDPNKLIAERDQMAAQRDQMVGQINQINAQIAGIDDLIAALG